MFHVEQTPTAEDFACIEAVYGGYIARWHSDWFCIEPPVFLD